jgi:fatty-acyl-CoA synthase
MEIPLTLQAILDEHAVARPDRIALVQGEVRVTYAQLDTLSRGAAAWLSAQGVRAGDRVAVWLVNRVEWLALLFGLARLGAALVAVNTRYRTAELEYVLERSEARMLVLQSVFRTLDFRAILDGVRPSAARGLECVGIVEEAQRSALSPVLGKPAVRFEPHSAPAAGGGAADPNALAALFTTSGTTRGPKLVMHPQRTLALHARRVARACGLDSAGASLLAALPFCGVFGLNGVLAALAAGAPIIIMETFDAAAAAELIRRHGVTHTFGSDEMFRRILDAAAEQDPFPSARVFGFAAFHPGAAELARAAWGRGIPLTGLYGSSEVQALFALQPASLPLDERIEAGGRPASCEDAAVRVRDVDTGDLLPAGRAGELEIRAPTNFVGYLNDPGATARAILPDGFFRTGDVGRLRADGTFVYESRQGDAIRLGGFLVNPSEIEDALKRIPTVADAQVVAAEISGQVRCVAFVIPAPGAAPREAEVIAASRTIVAGFKVPARVWFVDAFPTAEGANGTKIQRARLREMALERLGATA